MRRHIFFVSLGANDDTRGRRFIPSTSVDEYAATLARWFGVGDGDLGDVAPQPRTLRDARSGFRLGAFELGGIGRAIGERQRAATHVHRRRRGHH